MPSTFISFKDRGYWIPDGIIAVIAKYMARAIINQENNAGWLIEYGACLTQLIGEGSTGWANLNFDQVLINEERLLTMKEILTKAILEIKKEGEQVSVKSLNNLYPYQSDISKVTNWIVPVQTEKVVSILYRLIDIIEGYEGFDVKTAPYLTF